MKRCGSVLALLALWGCGPDVMELVPLPDGALAGRYHPIPNAQRVVFGVLGDTGKGTSSQYDVGAALYDVCQTRGCHFVIVLGDNIYEDGIYGVDDPQLTEKFEGPYTQFGDFDFWMTLGNHDWYGNAQAQIDYTLHSERWLMPHNHYPVLGLPSWLHLYAFDSQTLLYAPDLGPRQWQDLSAYMCTRDGWHMLFAHHPARSYGKHGDHELVGAYVWSLAQRCGVDVYFAGHDHDQQLVYDPSFLQVVQGAGATVRPVHKGKDTLFAGAVLGFTIVEVTPTELDITFYNVAAEVLFEFGRRR